MSKIKKVALVNRKGGCGKTTSLFSIAGVLAGEMNQKVLAIDLDAQCNTTSTMTMYVDDADSYKTVMDVLHGADVEDAVCGVLWQGKGLRNYTNYGVDVLCGDAAIDSSEGIVAIPEEQIMNAGKRINEYINERGYDWVLVDMPPSSKVINDFCFKYLADYALIPFSPDAYSASGYSQIMNDMADAREVNPSVRVIGSFMAKRDSRFGMHKALEEDMAELDSYICSVPYEAAIAESTYFGRPVCFYKSNSKGSEAYRMIVKEIDKRIKMDY